MLSLFRFAAGDRPGSHLRVRNEVGVGVVRAQVPRRPQQRAVRMTYYKHCRLRPLQRTTHLSSNGNSRWASPAEPAEIAAKRTRRAAAAEAPPLAGATRDYLAAWHGQRAGSGVPPRRPRPSPPHWPARKVQRTAHSLHLRPGPHGTPSRTGSARPSVQARRTPRPTLTQLAQAALR